MNVYKRQNRASNNKYAQPEDFKTDFERKLDRYKYDGVRMYDDSYAKPIEDSLPIIKAVRLG